MKKVIFLLFLFLFFSLSVKSVFADLSCRGTFAYDYEDSYSPNIIINITGIGAKTYINSVVEKSEEDQILERYIFDGYSWKRATKYEWSSSYYDIIYYLRTYPEIKDFSIAGGWIYKDKNGDIKSFICREMFPRLRYLHVFNKTYKDFGFGVGPGETKTVSIENGGEHIGAFTQTEYEEYSWYGYNNASPITPWKYDLFPNSYWQHDTLEAGGNTDGDWHQNMPNIWGYYYLGSSSELNPNLPTQVNITLFGATFNPGEGNNSYSSLKDRVIAVYSRPKKEGNIPAPPPPLERCSYIYGYVKDATNPNLTDPLKPGIAGATVSAHGVDDASCNGGHSDCGTVTTNEFGKFEVNCNLPLEKMECLRVREEKNAPGYSDPVDSQLLPTGPTGSTAWDFNEIVYRTPVVGDCGPFIFYDQKTLAKSWFQTQEGDVHGGGDIQSRLPKDNFFSLTGEGGFPGLVSYNGDEADFNLGEVSSTKWLAKTPARAKFYDYFYPLLGYPTLEEPLFSKIRNEDLPSGGVKAYNINIETGEDLLIGGRKIVILTSGKFLIKNKILIDQGGSLVVIAKGGIGVSKNLETTGTGNSYLEGIFITDGTFFSSVDEDFTFSPAVSQNTLVIRGGVIANEIKMTRDLASKNSTTPAEKFIYRPDLLLNSYPGIWERKHLWSELAP